MIDMLTQRLLRWGDISGEEHHLAGLLQFCKARCLPARHVVTAQAGKGTMCFVLRGWICQYGQLHDGRRQIVSLRLPGDFVICSAPTAPDSEPAFHTLTESMLLEMPPEKFRSLCAASPKLASLFRRAENVQVATSREWVLSLGVRKSKERCAHLICEILWRLRAVNLVSNGWFDFPLTQDDLGYAIGTTTVTVNKALQELRQAEMVEQRGRKMRVTDRSALEALAQFDPTFLSLEPWSFPDVMRPNPSPRYLAVDARRP